MTLYTCRLPWLSDLCVEDQNILCYHFFRLCWERDWLCRMKTTKFNTLYIIPLTQVLMFEFQVLRVLSYSETRPLVFHSNSRIVVFSRGQKLQILQSSSLPCVIISYLQFCIQWICLLVLLPDFFIQRLTRFCADFFQTLYKKWSFH